MTQTTEEQLETTEGQEIVMTEEQAAWTRLYEVASAFKKMAPWTWQQDSRIFGVRNPEDGEIGYCSIMGASETLFGLAVFRGAEGLESLNDMLIDRDERYAWLHRQKCMMITYEDRTDLDKQDLAQIKELGFRFRGRNAWPMFRVYDPGLAPWTLNEQEVQYLTMALEQAMDIATRVKKDKNVLVAPKPGKVLVREQVSGEWADVWMDPEFILQRPVKVEYDDAARLTDIMERFPNKKGHWETEFFFAPVAVKGEASDRPYYPRLCLWVDRVSRSAVGFHVTYDENFEQQFLDHFLNLIEEKGNRPQKLVIRTNETIDLFEKTAQRLKVKIEREPRLTYLEEARGDLVEYFVKNAKK
ncbi:DUF7309 domain-containing protein [Paenibacillus sp. 481]|uniref:DUF7309 domain-containing protein n=1 Tax=Paenibacillus sp. 481 TaxID=2835869 RepID=UPI001E641A68|nr:hypothetical protein [Paenibacillus sp. 481]UHA74881.1 hypothetical protein KIK04_07510 [Paenibacillus sp. 481]